MSLLFFIEPGPSSGNCLLNKGKFDYIKTKENCTSRIKYQHNTCRGTCESTSTSTYGETGLDSFCACCQPSVGKLWTATLDCPNNEVRSTNFFEIRACRCRQFKCVSEQDKSGMEEINEKGQVLDVNQQCRPKTSPLINYRGRTGSNYQLSHKFLTLYDGGVNV